MPNMTAEQLIDGLAEVFGIDPEYYDIFGQRHVISIETKRAILAAMGVDTTTYERMALEWATAQERAWLQPCEPVLDGTHQPASGRLK